MKKRIINALICMCMVVAAFSVNVFASNGNGHVQVPKSGYQVLAEQGITRTGSYSYAKVRADSVTPVPPYGADTFTKCQARLFDCNNTLKAISDWYTLTEGSDYTKLKIYEGCYSKNKFNLNFKGNNSNYAAEVYYSYKGL